jgi:hypothetical protein
LTPEVIDHGGMVAVAMRVHAASDTNRRPCHAGHALPLPFAAVRWAHGAVGIGGQASDVRLCAGSYEVTPPRPFACNDVFRRADGSIQRQHRASGYGESDPAEDVSHILTGLRAAILGRLWQAHSQLISPLPADWPFLDFALDLA